MPKPFRVISTWVVIAGLAAAALSGCSRESRKASALAKADSYFNAGEYEKAEIEYKNALQLDRSDSYPYAKLGEIYWQQGRLGQSYGVLKLAIDLKSDNVDARLRQGFANLSMGKRVEARDAAMFVLERRPTDPEAPLLLAESISNPNDATAARNVLEKLSSAQSAPVLTALALIRSRERKYPEAEALVGQALQLDPKYAPGHSTLAGVFLARKDVASAEKSLARAVELSPLRSPIRLLFVQFNLQHGKADAAKRDLEEMIQKTPDFLPAYISRANIAKAEKRYQECIDLLKRLLERDPLHPEGLLLMADAYLSASEPDNAIAALEKAAASYPKAPQVHFHLGRAHVAKGDLDKAAASLADAVRLEPEFAQAVLMLAQVNIRQRNLVAAVSLLEDFLKQNPKSAEGQVLLGEAYRQQGNSKAALAIYHSLSEANPKNSQIHMAIGSVLLQQDKKEEARESFAKALELSPGFAPAVEQLVNLDLAAQQHDSALRQVEALISKNPASAAGHLLLAKVHRATGNQESIEAALKKAIELEPESATAYSLLSQYYLDTKQAEKAIPALRAVGEKTPGNVGPWMTLGAIYLSKKDHSGAKESFEKVLAINPNHGVALNDLASLYIEPFGDLERALDLAQKAREVLPTIGETADTLGWIYYLKGQYARALILLEECIDKLPNHPEALYHAGMAYYMMGKEDEARVSLEKALQINGELRGAAEAKQRLAILTLRPEQVAASRGTIDAALARQKDDPVALARLATLYEREGNGAKAVSTFESVLASNPANSSAAVNLIRLYRARNETAKALDLAKATRKVAPADGRIAHALGRLAFESGDHPWSVGVLQEASRQLTGSPDVLFDLGEALYSVGRVSSAQISFRDALGAGKDFSRAQKAREYLEMMDIAEKPAEGSKKAGTVEAVLKADASNVAGLMANGALSEHKGDVTAARQSYLKAIARFPDFTPAKRRLVILYAKYPEDDKMALELAGKAREAFPNDAELAKAFGILLYRQGNHSRAAALLRESARSLTKDGEIQFYLGMSERKLHNETAATTALQKALELGLPQALKLEAEKLHAAAK